MNRFMDLVASLLLLFYVSCTFAGYLQEDERDYLQNFMAHMANSHSDGDHADILNACRASPPYLEGRRITVQDTLSSGTELGFITSSEVQQQCHESYLCVIPPHLTVKMTESLHVGALEVKGNLLWTDDTQVRDEAYLCAGYVAIEGGSFAMNLQSSKRAWIYLTSNGAHHKTLGWRGFGGVKALSVEIRGRPLQRTWTLLDQPLHRDSTTMKLLHDPVAMGWRIGDRIAVAPTDPQSKGSGQSFEIEHMTSDGTILMSDPSHYNYKADYKHSRLPEVMAPILMAAEVINLSRNIVITGDDFENIPCDPRVKNEADGCMCTGYRDTCTIGLHTAMQKSGTMRISNTRIEKCGQRGIMGKYCLHFHELEDCPDCLLSGNAIESSQQRGIVIHNTHRSLVERNVLWNVRGSGIYIEDGNEMYNSIEYNVIICPYPLEDPVHHGCTIPGTSAGSSDDRRNQAGFYLKSSTNDLIGNRAANSRNGMFAEAGMDGNAKGKVCPQQTGIGRWEGNTFHGHARFGTYPINFYPQDTDRSLDSKGYNINPSLCDGFDSYGNTNGSPTAILNHLDYDNIFVGQYEVGDIQYRGHVSVNNKNLIYWKETKNFEDGCAAHIANSFYSNGKLALPDQATVILQDMVMENVVLEANHHCQVGSTGYLCMPQYILHNVDWSHDDPSTKWMAFQHGETNFGGIFSLSPNSDVSKSPFPKGYVSLVSDRYDYLLDAPRDVCVSSYHLGLEDRYDNGILCKVPLRSLKVYSRGLRDNSEVPSLKVEVWFNNHNGIAQHSATRPSTTQFYPFHQIDGDSKRQGYSFPVIPSLSVSYRLSLNSGDRGIPDDWVIEFSDPVVGNRWGEEYVQLELRGRPCSDKGIISSHHDRRFIYSGMEFLDDKVWGDHGACVKANKMPSETCGDANGNLKATECPDLCNGCNAATSYCECRTATCRCKVGFMGDDCSIDLCVDSCGSKGACTGLYLGATLPIHSSERACMGNEMLERRHLLPTSSSFQALNSWVGCLLGLLSVFMAF